MLTFKEFLEEVQKVDEHHLHRLSAEFEKPERNHAKIGTLLGYPKDAIRKFTDSMR